MVEFIFPWNLYIFSSSQWSGVSSVIVQCYGRPTSHATNTSNIYTVSVPFSFDSKFYFMPMCAYISIFWARIWSVAEREEKNRRHSQSVSRTSTQRTVRTEHKEWRRRLRARTRASMCVCVHERACVRMYVWLLVVVCARVSSTLFPLCTGESKFSARVC